MRINKVVSARVYVASAIFTAFAPRVYAIAPPLPTDAGQTTQQLKPQILEPKADSFSIDVPVLHSDETVPGGMQVAVNKIIFSGNANITEKQLLDVIADFSDKKLDVAGLKYLAVRISAYYRQHGFPFARAYLPAQNLTQGQLIIGILEGQYGAINTSSTDTELAIQAKSFLSGLVPQHAIKSDVLERAALILSDQPGIKANLMLEPGAETGAGNLLVDIKRATTFAGNIGFDNTGNRYTGYNRGTASVAINSPFMLGDQITFSGVYTDEDMWFGNAGYSLPVFGDGLRANYGYSHTYYQLGKDFAALDAKGEANIWTAGFSYPLLRSQQANLSLSATYQYKDISDDQGRQSLNHHKNSHSIPVSLSFDVRDNFLDAGAVTYGALVWTRGYLSLDSTLKAYDINNTQGDYDKFTVDVARNQSINDSLSLYIHGVGQWSDKNLDSSEGFGIGGVAGVRAFPTGEGYGNVGWLTQTELRYKLDENYVPYIFFDAGGSRTNQTTIVNNNSRNVSGTGFGLVYKRGPWSADMSASWEVTGGRPEDSNTPNASPRFWGTLKYSFD